MRCRPPGLVPTALAMLVGLAAASAVTGRAGEGALVRRAHAERSTSFWRRHAPPAPWEVLHAEGLGHLMGARLLRIAFSFDQRDPARRREVQDRIDGHAIAARAAFNEALELAPDEPALHYAAFVTSSTYLDEERPERHEAVLRHVEALRVLAPLHAQRYALEDAYVHALAKLGARATGAEALALFARAAHAYEEHLARNDEAALFASRPDSPFSNAAEIYMAAGRLPEALRFYQRSVALGPTQPLNHYGLALALHRSGENESALRAMREALRLDTRGELATADEKGAAVYFVPSGDKFAYQALAAEAQGRTAEAVAAWTRFLVRAVDAQPAYRALARDHLARLRGGPRVRRPAVGAGSGPR